MKTRTIKPVQMTCKCIAKPTYFTPECEGYAGEVIINEMQYTIRCLGETSRDGYRLVNQRSRKVYDVDTASGYPVCDCPDFLTRRGTMEHPACKHGLALIQLRKERVI